MKSINALISANNISVIKNEKAILKNIDIQINICLKTWIIFPIVIISGVV